MTSRLSALQSASRASPVKTLDRLEVMRVGAEVRVGRRGPVLSLHHQVRNMVGTLRLVGERRWPVERVAAALAACDRSQGGPTAGARRALSDRGHLSGVMGVLRCCGAGRAGLSKLHNGSSDNLVIVRALNT